MPIPTLMMNTLTTLMSMSYTPPSHGILLVLKSTITTIKSNIKRFGPCKNDLFRLTTALTLTQFIHVGNKKKLTSFTAPKANDYSIGYYDHDIIRPNEDHCPNYDNYANPN